MKKYIPFNKYILRTPLFPLSDYLSLTKGKDISIEKLINFYQIPIVKESLFIASPVLYEEIEKLKDGSIIDSKKINRIKISLLKYITRMCSRCTPFGLFAGVCVGEFASENKIIFDEHTRFSRHTRLDMEYLVKMADDLSKNSIIREQLLFYSNNSLYEVGNHLRYIEYKYIDGQRKHSIVAVERSVYLDYIIEISKDGLKICQIEEILVNQGASPEDAKNYLDQLIESQILISELEPNVTGKEFFDIIIEKLECINNIDSVKSSIDNIRQLILKLDINVSNSPRKYYEIFDILKDFNSETKLKNLFQVDLVSKPIVNNLDANILKLATIGFNILNRITNQSKLSRLEDFKNNILRRYEYAEVELSKVIDTEVGIGYGRNSNIGVISPLIDDLYIYNKEKKEEDIKWSTFLSLMNKKLINAIRNNEKVITLNDDDINDFDLNNFDLPDTMSSITNIVKIDGQVKLVMNGVGGCSAADLLARFCYGDNKLNKYVYQIANKEKELNPNVILAEICHLPESRVGNILARPDFRDFEIPYLAKTLKDRSHSIELDDIMISVGFDNNLRLRSKKLNKFIIPRLTNAHNYTINSLPLYEFLADYQMQNLRPSLSIDISPFKYDYKFIPRIEYNNIVLSESHWYLKKESLKNLIKNDLNDENLIININTWREKYNIPKLILLVVRDNELLINLENALSIRMFLNEIKQDFVLKEFMFTNDTLVKSNKNDNFTNQVIMSFYKD